jgi:PAS domain S-box-containing protein
VNHPPKVFGASGTSVFGPGAHGPVPATAAGTAHHQAPIFSAPAPVSPPEWRAILDQLPYGLIVLGPGQELRHENATCRQLLGYGVGERGGVEGWLAAVCPDRNHREKVINSWREHIWRNQLTRTFTLKTAGQKLKEIEFRSSLLRDGGITLTIEDVTETRRTEETLRHGKLKFRALFSHTETGTVLVDRTGRIIDANPAFLALAGILLKDLRLSSLAELLHPNEAAELSGAEDTLSRIPPDHGAAKVVTRDVWLRTSTAEKRTRVTYCPVGEGPERPTMAIYLFTALDAVSANERLTARLRVVSAKAQALLHAVPDLILLIEPDGSVADFAPPPKPWSELTPDDSWRGQPATTVWPVFGSLLRQCQDQVTTRGKTIHADIRGPEDDRFEFAVTLSPCGDGQILAVIRNHTATRALRERDLWQSASFTHCPLPIVMLDNHGIVSGANLAASDYLGLGGAELTGQDFADFCDGGEESLREAITCAASGMGRWTSHRPMRTAGGEALRTMADFLALEQDGKPRGSLVFLERRPEVAEPEVLPPIAEVPAPAPAPEVGPAPATATAFPGNNERRQHGFRNQLQLVTSLFSLEPQGAAARDAFLRWQIRLRSMAQACPYGQSDNVWVFPLLRSLADEVCSLIGRGPGRREVIITGSEDLTLEVQTATPFSLLIGELMRLVLATRQAGPGPELYINLRTHAGGGFQLTMRPGTYRQFVFTDRDTELEILELLTEQIQGRLEATDQENPGREWVLIVPPLNR